MVSEQLLVLSCRGGCPTLEGGGHPRKAKGLQTSLTRSIKTQLGHGEARTASVCHPLCVPVPSHQPALSLSEKQMFSALIGLSRSCKVRFSHRCYPGASLTQRPSPVTAAPTAHSPLDPERERRPHTRDTNSSEAPKITHPAPG